MFELLGGLASSGLIGMVVGGVQNISNTIATIIRENQMMLAGQKRKDLVTKETAAFDTNKDNQVTRRIMVWVLFGTLSIGMLYTLIFQPDQITTEMIPRARGLFGWLTGTPAFEMIEKHFTEHFDGFMKLCGLVMGYYMSRVRNQK